MKSRQIALAAVAAAAAALSACSTNASPKAWDSGAPSPVAAETPEWISVPWMKVNANAAGDQFGGVPTPGIVIAQENGTDPYLCTLGVAVRTTIGPGFLTAGHCNEHPGNELHLYPSADITGADSITLPSPYTDVSDSDGKPDPATGAATDHAVVPLPKLTPYATVIAGNYRVAGVFTTDAAKKLSVDTPICFDGAVSGVRCGVVKGDDNGALRFAAAPGAPTDTPFISKGDSGAAVFTVDSQKRVALVGLLSSGTKAGDIGWASYLDAALGGVNAKAVLDSSATKFAGPSFSQRISTE
ncbi:hypothetical protein [Mycobacteroides abscessus]|uniref:hypothetical protein n=1 Tax=Mycobacteroides abscessus TaxID=36809 RepID=UPI000943E218|nr:hypothetical protein [Mycobacteroides abscessus]